MRNRFCLTGVLFLSLTLSILSPQSVYAEVIVQWFETEWDDMYQRLPLVAEIGFDGIWHPSPCKAPIAGVFPNGGGGNVGYNLFDRFDVGEHPQRGTLATRYGTRGSLRNMTDSAHNCDIRIYPDVVFNHTGNGPHIDTYPGMRYYDFHGWDDGAFPLGFKRTARMSDYDPNDGDCDQNFQQELVSLIDIVTEPDSRFSSGSGWPCDAGMVTPGNYVRHPGMLEKYPDGSEVSEHPVDFLERWIEWLGNAEDWDGVRLDAPKHVVREFFGEPAAYGFGGFNQRIQDSFDDRRGHSDGDDQNEMYWWDIRRDDALIFSEMFIYSKGEVGYWRDWNGGAGPDNANGVKMRYLDFPLLKQMMTPAFNGGNMASLGGLAAFGQQEGITFVHSHDEDSIGKKDLAYAFALTHIGIPIVYFTGNNYDPADQGSRNWLKIGYESAMGDWGHGVVPNLIYIHNQFARNWEWKKWDDGDVYIFERFENLDSSVDGYGNYTPTQPEGLLLVGLNDSGWDQPRTITTCFPDGTVLHDYTGNNPTDITVSGSSVTLTIPGMGGQGWVCYAPRIAGADGDPIRFSSATTMPWIIPDGRMIAGDGTLRNVTRLTNDTVDINVHYFDPSDASVGDVKVKWGGGWNIGGTSYSSAKNFVHGGFMGATNVSGPHWRLSVDLTGVPEGLHLVKARAFNGGAPVDRFQTFHETVYVDRHGPDLDILNLTNSATIDGDRTIEIANTDKTAGYVEVKIDSGAWQPAHEIMKGTWKYTIQGQSAAAHTVEVRAREYDYAASPNVINTSTLSRNFSVSDTSGMTLTMNHGEGDPIYLPFFETSGGVGPGTLTLLWDGYILDNVATNGGNYTNFFTGQCLSGGQPLHFTGAFVNGPHFLEAVLVNGGNTKVVSRTVHFNLYNMVDDPDDWRYAYDSDGDGIPDDIEAPGFTDGTFPGPNVQWPGDNGGGGDGAYDMIPQSWEFWEKLNPMNHDTFYDSSWDGDDDWDQDGFPNLCEVIQGYLLNGNPAHYNIYDAGSHPDTCESGPVAAQISWSPQSPDNCDGSTVTFSYVPNEGPLEGYSAYVQVGVLTNGVLHGEFSTTDNGGTLQYTYNIDTNTTAMEVYFVVHNDNDHYDNNDDSNYTVPITTCVHGDPCFVMDGEFDSAHYEVANSGMKILAAASDDCFYVATWSAHTGDGSGNDHFIYVTDEPGDAEAAPWGKSGIVMFDKANDPWVAGESDTYDNGYHGLENGGALGRADMGANGSALEAEFNLVEVFGYRPDVLYIAAVAYGDDDGSDIDSQCPSEWYGEEWDDFLSANVRNLDRPEFLPVCVESVQDRDLDGRFDKGAPTMESEVGGNTRDANYDLRRFFIDELTGESHAITVRLYPNLVGNNATDVELISNLNRRDFAAISNDLDLVTAGDLTTYFRAYPMTPVSGDGFETTLLANRCGAYRINARYKVGGTGNWVYYSDNCLRRDLAVVVSPTKALDLTMYEVNPLTAEATEPTDAGRSTFEDLYIVNTDRADTLNTSYYTNLGVNMLWLQPIHPIGTDSKGIDPDTGSAWDPGSPYAVKDYWSVNPKLGDDDTPADAMAEFQAFVSAMDGVDVGVMMDGTFNHSAPDVVFGQGAADLFPWASNTTQEIRMDRPQWFAKAGSPGEHATHYISGSINDIAIAPDRIDFGKWTDVREFWFGSYDCLVKGGSPGETTSRHFREFLSERDAFFGHDMYAAEVWEYFAYYPLFWLDRSGCPVGTPKSESYKGIDGLRCDFAQGLPNQFWEYCINKTRQRKWDFIFMAESLDGFRDVGGSKHHGVGYRSSRHFDVLNENLLFYWRDPYFNYFKKDFNGDEIPDDPDPRTGPTRDKLTDRRDAFDASSILLNLTGHDEVLPSHDPWRLFYAYAELAAVDGLPMLFYGQEAGLQNDHGTYENGEEIPDDTHNFEYYEVNFGKSIPNFKRYNSMTNVWTNANTTLRAAYGRVNQARLGSPALRSQGLFFLNDWTTGYVRDDIFAVAKFEEPGVSAATQDVVFAFVNNNHWSGDGYGTNLSERFNVNTNYSNGKNWFGIISGHDYNVVDLLSTTPTNELWSPDKPGSELLTSGLWTWLHENPVQGKQAQYIKLIDKTGPWPDDNDMDGLNDWQDPDDDNDGMPDEYEENNGLDKDDPDDEYGWDGDKDGDGVPNGEEMIAGTDPDAITDFLAITGVATNPVGAEVVWRSVSNINYRVEHKDDLLMPGAWTPDRSLTAGSSNETVDVSLPSDVSNRFWRVQVIQ